MLEYGTIITQSNKPHSNHNNTGPNSHCMPHESDNSNPTSTSSHPSSKRTSHRQSDPNTSSHNESNVLKETTNTEPKEPLSAKKKTKAQKKHRIFTRRMWSDSEDKAISELVTKYGIRRWTLVSQRLQDDYRIYGRSGKQCRERYQF